VCVLTYHHVAAAADIGMLARERDTASACGEALRILSRTMPTDAGALIGVDPLSGAHFQLAGIAYSPEVTRSTAVDFVGSPWFRDVLSQPLPPSISDDADHSFQRGWFYEQHVRPAGFRDAITGALRQRGRYVGMVVLSTTRPNAFDAEARHLLRGMLPALAVLADLPGRAGEVAELPVATAGALFTPDGIVDLPERERPPALDDIEFRRLLTGFAGSNGDSLRLYWPIGRTWHRVWLRRHVLASAPGVRAVLVHSEPAQLPYGLSARELDVLTRIAMGEPNRTIAQGLFVSPRTVHSHIEHILRKLGVASRAEAAALAVREDLLRPTGQQHPSR
jgi:DNA-binding CsgD family transcriptional regulator